MVLKSGITLPVKKSRSGKGLFTEKDIPTGTRIIEYIGRPASAREKKQDTGKYLFWADEKTMINGNIPENRARYINHSCIPNCEAGGPGKRIYISARRHIKAGEELTYDYGDEYFNKHIKPKGCRCEKCIAR